MLASGAMNLLVAGIWFLSLVWLCIGVYWLIPMALAVGEMLVGALALAGIRMRFGRVAAVVGALNGLMLLNVYATTLQGVALALQLLAPVPEWLALEDRVDSPPP